MENSKKTDRKASATDRVLARPGTGPTPSSPPKSGKNVSLDAILAEKDEVKNAEQELKRRQQENKQSEQ